MPVRSHPSAIIADLVTQVQWTAAHPDPTAAHTIGPVLQTLRDNLTVTRPRGQAVRITKAPTAELAQQVFALAVATILSQGSADAAHLQAVVSTLAPEPDDTFPAQGNLAALDLILHLLHDDPTPFAQSVYAQLLVYRLAILLAHIG